MLTSLLRSSQILLLLSLAGLFSVVGGLQEQGMRVGLNRSKAGQQGCADNPGTHLLLGVSHRDVLFRNFVITQH
jgi:hypothetical protein